MKTGDLWHDFGYFPSPALAGIGDPRLLGDDVWRDKALPYLRVRRSGYGMVYAMAEADGLPVEVLGPPARPTAVRLEYVDDVAELERSGEGVWRVLGRLRIGGVGAVAISEEDGDVDVLAVPLPAGWYQAEAFESNSDSLGVRLMPCPLEGREATIRAT